MLLIPCPICGPRPESEFIYGGEAHLVRPAEPAAVSDADWAAFLFERSNVRGVQAERWRHLHGCARFFNVLRDTTSDRILTSYPAGQPRPDRAAPDQHADADPVPAGSDA